MHYSNFKLIERVEEKKRCEGLPSILSVFPNEFNKFNNSGARVQDSIYHMALNHIFFEIFAGKRQDFAISKRDVHIDFIADNHYNATYPRRLNLHISFL